ncbi:MAG TPA: leucine--tRNA ligase [Planctomycetota bacterium]|jgi:leucyl-tRNA synthetase
MPSAKYTPTEIEPKWQRYWAEHNSFAIPNPGQPGFDASKPKFYVLDMFPYPSGAGLHVGHPEGYTATDILARWRRMRGYNVLHPMGWDAFGLPAEQYAMQTGTHPAVTTQKNINSFRDTLQRLGFSYDWTREVDTTDPKYYRWTQWIFLKLFNSIFDTQQQRARDVREIVADLDAGKISIRGAGCQPASSSGKPEACGTIVFDTPAAAGLVTGWGRQWSDLNADERWKLLANHRLAYVSEAPVWWCEALGTVLANEEVIDGRSERGDHPCIKKPLRQWMLRITAYAERLIDDLEGLDWPEPIKLMQRHWIGRSEGAEVDFERVESKIQNPKSKIRVFTTRPDTLYGATYMVLAPEHPLVKEITTPEQKAAVEQYVLETSRKSDLARTDLAKDKSGVFTGAYAFNPVYDCSDPRAKIPIWIADYVLMGYGTGAIMAVPAHDTRDAEFAVKFKLPITSVVMPPDSWLKENAPADADPKALRERFIKDPTAFKSFFVDDGTAFNSPIFDGLPTPEAKTKIAQWLQQKGLGEGKVTYRLRDWLFSRQRYWGEPFPIVWDSQGHARPLTDDQLPLMLPEMSDFKPTGSTEPPLSKAKDWLNVNIAVQQDGSARVIPAGTEAGATAVRETNTMPQWAGSCWYYLRYLDARNNSAPFSAEAEKYWMNVDLYVGGAEHAVLHLLYSRFWHKVLFDRGIVHTNEPFQRLFNQGLITAFAYKDDTGRLLPVDEVEEKGEGNFVVKATGGAAKQIVAKMSKTLKNVVNPHDVMNEYGADTLRLYEMFMGPLEASKPWNPRDVPGVFRFLRDSWRMIIDDDESKPTAGSLRPNLASGQGSGFGVQGSGSASDALASQEPRAKSQEPNALERDLHKTIKGVTQDLERMAFNTAISKLMVFKNKVMENVSALNRSQAERFVLLLAPFAPHLAEELWSRLGHEQSLIAEKWPTYDEALTQDAMKELAVQVNGKIRARITVAANAPDEDVKATAQQAVAADLAGKKVVKVIVVPGKLVNIVVK